MKFLILFFLGLSLSVFGQQAGDVGYLYLRDGSVFHGKIIEVNSFEDITIALLDKTILTIEKRRIRRFVVENKKKDLIFGLKMPTKGSVSVGVAFSRYYNVGKRHLLLVNRDIGLDIEVKYNLSEFLRVGPGVGYQHNSRLNSNILMPNANAEVVIPMGKVVPVAGIKLGIATTAHNTSIGIGNLTFDLSSVHSTEAYAGLNFFTRRRLHFRFYLGFEYLNLKVRNTQDGTKDRLSLLYTFLRYAIAF